MAEHNEQSGSDSGARSEVSQTAAGLSGSGWLLILGVLAVLALLAGTFRWGGNSNAAELLRSVPATGVDNVEITTTALGIDITRAAGSNIEVELTGGSARRLELIVEQSGTTLQISAVRRNRFLGFLPPFNAHLSVGLPAGQLELLKADSSSGAITAGGFAAAEAQFRSSSGQITIEESDVTGTLQATSSSGRSTLEQVAARSYDLSSNSGRINASGLNGAVQARTSSGSINLEAEAISADWTLRSSSGSINVTLAQKPAALRVEYQGSSGSWSVPSNWNLDSAGQRRNQLSAQIGSGGPLLSVTTSSGSFTVR